MDHVGGGDGAKEEGEGIDDSGEHKKKKHGGQGRKKRRYLRRSIQKIEGPRTYSENIINSLNQVELSCVWSFLSSKDLLVAMSVGKDIKASVVIYVSQVESQKNTIHPIHPLQVNISPSRLLLYRVLVEEGASTTCSKCRINISPNDIPIGVKGRRWAGILNGTSQRLCHNCAIRIGDKPATADHIETRIFPLVRTLPHGATIQKAATACLWSDPGVGSTTTKTAAQLAKDMGYKSIKQLFTQYKGFSFNCDGNLVTMKG